MSGIVDQIVKYGKVTRPVLGISFAPEQAVDQLGVSGVLVLDAPPSGPAGRAVSTLTSILPDPCTLFFSSSRMNAAARQVYRLSVRNVRYCLALVAFFRALC